MSDRENRRIPQEVVRRVRPYRMHVVTITLTVMLISLGVVPNWASGQEVRRRLAERQRVVRILTEKTDRLEHTEVGTLQEKLELAMHAVPVDVPFQSSLSTLDALISREGIGVRDISFSVEQTRGSPSLIVSMEVVGTYQSLLSFISRFSQTLPLASIPDISLGEMSEDAALGYKGASQFKATLTVDFFYVPLPQSVEKPSDEFPAITSAMQEALQSIQSFESVSSSAPSTGSFEPVDRLFPSL